MPKADRLLARILDTPHLARAVPHLAPTVLHRLIESCRLEDCGELVALATPEQLSAVFDLDLWRSAQPGMEEEFDAARFALWLEVLAESGTVFAAGRLAEIDISLVIAALARYIAVYDPAVIDGVDVLLPSVLKHGVSREVGGYVVAARRTDAWDTIVDVLVALDEAHPDCFHRVMQGCRRLSYSTPELDGFHDVLPAREQARFDLAVDRERRRDRLGYVSPEQARAFLDSSRQARAERDGSLPPNPIATAAFRAAEEAHEPSSSEHTASAVATVVDLLVDAGVMPDGPRALLGAGDGQTRRLARIQRHMQFVRDADAAAYASRSQELAFLANVLLAGCSVQARPFTAREAFDAAVATCNLGLENWPHALPGDFLAGHDLTSVFQVGWAVLYRDVCVFVTEQLVNTLGDLEIGDREIQLGLHGLRRELARHLQAGSPWRAREALDVLAMLDMPAWAALVGLIAECPVMLANVSATGQSRPHSIDPTVFELISETEHVTAVRAFMHSLPGALSR